MSFSFRHIRTFGAVFVVAIAVVSLAGCDSSSNSNSSPLTPDVVVTPGLNSLIKQSAIETGSTQCPEGGVEIQSGVDLNSDGTLEPNEVTQTSVICNGGQGAQGTSGLYNLVNQIALPSGSAQCPYGGTLIQSGLDTNGNGVLDPSEVMQTQYLCNGVPGAAGANGTNGTNGAAGVSALINSIPIAVGSAQCPYGGVEVQSGQDLNGDGILEPNEVTQNNFACNGAPGSAGASGLNSLVNQIALSVGSTACAYGGVEIQSGLDLNADGILEAGEVTETNYACNGATGAMGSAGAAGTSGMNSLVNQVSLASGSAQCPGGGVEIQSGLDLNADGMLEAGEVTQTNFLCNGTPGAAGTSGLNSLIKQTSLAVGSAQCAFGGIQIQSGLDLNSDGTLEASEVTQNTVVCNPDTCIAPRYSMQPGIACPFDAGPFASNIAQGDTLSSTYYTPNPDMFFGIRDEDSMGFILGQNVISNGISLIDAVSVETINPLGDIDSSLGGFSALNHGSLTAVASFDSIIYTAIGNSSGVQIGAIRPGFYSASQVGSVSGSAAIKSLAPVHLFATGIFNPNPTGIYYLTTGGAIGLVDLPTTFTKVVTGSTVYQVSGTVPSTLYGDTVNNRLYYAQGNAVYYIQLSLNTRYTPQALFKLPDTTGVVTSIATDGAGHVYANCIIPATMGKNPVPAHGCSGGELFRSNADGTGLTEMMDLSNPIFQLTYQSETHILYLLSQDAVDPAIGGAPTLNLDRLMIEN